MSNIIGIVNYGAAGNIHSVEVAVKKAQANTLIINKAEQFNSVDKIILPGVGSYKDAILNLKAKDLFGALQANKKPILGICLGMQILSKIGFEYGKTNGLGLIEAEVRPMIVDAKVPHVGFNNVEIIKKSNLFKGLDNKEFYFMHSFEVVNYTDVVSLTQYYGHKFVSSIEKENIYGVQFHPEKSREAGIEILKNFINLN